MWCLHLKIGMDIAGIQTVTKSDAIEETLL